MSSQAAPSQNSGSQEGAQEAERVRLSPGTAGLLNGYGAAQQTVHSASVSFSTRTVAGPVVEDQALASGLFEEQTLERVVELHGEVHQEVPLRTSESGSSSGKEFFHSAGRTTPQDGPQVAPSGFSAGEIQAEVHRQLELVRREHTAQLRALAAENEVLRNRAVAAEGRRPPESVVLSLGNQAAKVMGWFGLGQGAFSSFVPESPSTPNPQPLPGVGAQPGQVPMPGALPGVQTGEVPQTSGPMPGALPQASGHTPGALPQASGHTPGALPQASGHTPGALPQASGYMPGALPQASGPQSGHTPGALLQASGGRWSV